MPRVTIGVPVYNSQKLLEQCLENLAAQTFRDFKVIILDNASTDGTSGIAQEFQLKDQRFTYKCKSHNTGARQNFEDVLDLADTPYFMWRADDDWSDVNFIEEMVKLLDDVPSAALAVGRAELEKNGRRRGKRFPTRVPFEPAAMYRIRLLLKSRPSWIYGLFRTEEIRSSLKKVFAEFPHVNAFDHLALFPFLMRMRVVGSNNTTFFTGFVERTSGSKQSGFMDPRQMQTLRTDFIQHCALQLSGLFKNTIATTLMKPILWLYAERSYRFGKILSARLRILLGQSPTARGKNYD